MLAPTTPPRLTSSGALAGPAGCAGGTGGWSAWLGSDSRPAGACTSTKATACASWSTARSPKMGAVSMKASPLAPSPSSSSCCRSLSADSEAESGHPKLSSLNSPHNKSASDMSRDARPPLGPKRSRTSPRNRACQASRCQGLVVVGAASGLEQTHRNERRPASARGSRPGSHRPKARSSTLPGAQEGRLRARPTSKSRKWGGPCHGPARLTSTFGQGQARRRLGANNWPWLK